MGSPAIEVREFELVAPLDLALTCGPLARGRRDPSNRVAPLELWRAAHTPEGPATIHAVVRRAERRLTVHAWGRGARWLLDRSGGLLGLRDPGFDDALAVGHPAVARAVRATPGLRLAAAGAVDDVAFAAVVEQRVTGVEARRTWYALTRAFGEPAPGPCTLLLPPTADRLAALSDYELRTFGLEARRGAALQAVARSIGRIQRAADAGSAVLQRALLAERGVGPWTAASVAHLVCGDADAVIVGDWHLPRVVGFALAGELRADDDRMLELLEPFRPQRARVVRLLGAAGLGPPRTAPRAEIPDVLRREVRGQRNYRVRRTLRFTPD